MKLTALFLVLVTAQGSLILNSVLEGHHHDEGKHMVSWPRDLTDNNMYATGETEYLLLRLHRSQYTHARTSLNIYVPYIISI
jgi:hypothetical protein